MRLPHLLEGLAAAALFVCVHSPSVLRAQTSTGKLSVPEALGRLVPADAVGFLYLSSIDEVQSDLQSLASLSFEAKPAAAPEGADSAQAEAESAGADSTDMDLLASLAEWIGIDAAHVDRTRPLGIALNLYDLGKPTPLPVFILPAADPEGLLADLESRAGRPAPVTRGDYVGVALVPGYAPGQTIPAIATALPPRKLSLRLHPERIMAILQPFMEQGIEALLAQADSAGADSAAAKEFGAAGVSITRWYASLLQSCKTLDLGMESLDGRLDIDYSLTMLASEQSFFLPPARARGLVELAKCLPKDYPLVSLVGMDFDKYTEGFLPILGIMAEAAQQAGPAAQDLDLEWITQSFELYRQVQDQVLTATEFTKSGMEIVNVYVVKDATSFMAQARELLQAPGMQKIGFNVELAAPDRIEGIPIVTYRLRFDLAKLQGAQSEENPAEAMTPEEGLEGMSTFFGGEALVCRMGAVGNKVVTVCHPDPEPIAKVLAALKSGKGELPPSLGRVAARSAAPLCFWFSADLRNLFAPMADRFLEATATVAERDAAVRLSTGRPVPVTIYTVAGEEAYEGTASVDLDALAELLRELDSLSKKKGAAKDSER